MKTLTINSILAIVVVIPPIGAIIPPICAVLEIRGAVAIFERNTKEKVDGGPTVFIGYSKVVIDSGLFESK